MDNDQDRTTTILGIRQSGTINPPIKSTLAGGPITFVTPGDIVPHEKPHLTTTHENKATHKKKVIERDGIKLAHTKGRWAEMDGRREKEKKIEI